MRETIKVFSFQGNRSILFLFGRNSELKSLERYDHHVGGITLCLQHFPLFSTYVTALKYPPSQCFHAYTSQTIVFNHNWPMFAKVSFFLRRYVILKFSVGANLLFLFNHSLLHRILQDNCMLLTVCKISSKLAIIEQRRFKATALAKKGSTQFLVLPVEDVEPPFRGQEYAQNRSYAFDTGNVRNIDEKQTC